MRIDRIDIHDFRCFDEQTLDFDRRFTLLIGANATGKTAVLDALAVAVGAALIPVPEPNARSKPIRPSDARRTYVPGSETGYFVTHYPSQVGAKGELFGTELEWSRQLRSAKSRTDTRGAREVSGRMEDAVRRDARGDEVVLPYIAYYNTGRLWEPQRSSSAGGLEPLGLASRYTSYRQCLETPASTRDLARWVKRLALIETQRGVRLETLNGVYQSIATCVEGAVSASFDFEEDDIVVEFAERSRFPFRMLSDGQRSMAATAADIAMRCAQLNPHLNGAARLETPGVVLIDELDLHLHPRWQRNVVADLCEAFPRLQFVATSHSPFIVQSMSEGRVIRLAGKDTELAAGVDRSIEDVTEDVMGVDQPQRSRRYWQMVDAAEQYYKAIGNAAGQVDPARIRSLREQLDALEEPFADNPAYVAFLRLQRNANGLT